MTTKDPTSALATTDWQPAAGWTRLLFAALLALLALVVALFSLGADPTASAAAQDDESSSDLAPGGGRTMVVARPTWDTGWFQAELIAQLLVELGYRVDGPSTTENERFYTDVQDGSVDLWVNGWFPLHDPLLPDDSTEARRVGFEVRGGALQGYVIDLATVEAEGIETLADLADPETARLFDLDGDDRADLIGCNLEWACHEIVEHHLAAYGLDGTVEQVSGDYGPLMEAAVQRYRNGEPVLFYTFTPNWTGGVLVPGSDVAWVPVPEPSLPEALADQVDATEVPAVPGCLADPCLLGFPPSDIRSVANAQTLDGEPAIASLLESFAIPLADISAQNALMFRGEDAALDIERHAEAWIADNRDTVDGWLHVATDAHVAAGKPLEARPVDTIGGRFDVGSIRVAARPSAPFVTYDDGDYGGFTLDLLELVAAEIGAELEIYGVTSNAKLVDDVVRGEADVGAGALAVTSSREQQIDFSQPYFDSGLQILVPSEAGGIFGGRVGTIARTIFSIDLLIVCLSLLVVLFVSAHVIWLAERRSNPEFPAEYRAGIWEAFWWAAVTATTVGYGDKTPKGVAGRLFGLLWMFLGLFVLAYFTAGIASAFAIDELEGQIGGPADLRGHRVGVVADSLASEFVGDLGIPTNDFPQAEDAYDALLAGSLDAVVHDAASLQHFVTSNVDGGAQLTGPVFAERGFGFALEPDSELAEPINIGLINVIESGRYNDLHDRWFGVDD